MKNDERETSESAELRRHAEKQLKAQAPEASSSLTDDETRRLLHELQVHQIELEMQNEELRRAQAELDTERTRYFDLYDLAPVGYVTLDRAGSIRGINLTGADLLGIERSQLNGRRFNHFLADDARPAFAAFLGNVCASTTRESCEVELLNSEEQRVFVQIEAVSDVSGQDIRIGIINITKRKRAEKKLRESERRYASLFNNQYVSMILVDPETGRIINANPAACVFYGFTNENIASLSIFDINTLPRQDVSKLMDQAIKKETSLFYVRHRLTNGEIRDVEVYSAPIEIEEKWLLYSIVHDVTQRRELEEKLEQMHTDLSAHATELEAANVELEAFNYSVSHDLRRPLTNINAYCQVIQELCGSKLDEQCRGYIREIYEGTLRMNRLINNLIGFSRVTRIEMHHEQVDLSKLTEEVALGLKVTAPERLVTFRIAAGITAVGDAGLLRVVMDNLIGNAWKYTTGNLEETVIEFGVKEVDGKPACFVRDNGPGLDMAHADKLFIPFQRLPGNDVEGDGIGLATVERIVRRHGGRVWAESEPGRGATFLFTFK